MMHITDYIASGGVVGVLVYVILKEVFAFVKNKKNHHGNQLNPSDIKMGIQIDELFDERKEFRKVIYDIKDVCYRQTGIMDSLSKSMSLQTDILRKMENNLSELTKK